MIKMRALFKKEKRKFSLPFIGFWQALGLVVYCSLVGIVFWKADKWFGPPYGFWGPALFLTLFVVSAMISALIVLGYPFILFWEKKQTIEALKLVVSTAAWLILFIFFFILLFVVA